MQLKEFDIILDIKKNLKNESFEVVQNDMNTNVLNIILFDGLKAYSLEGLIVEIAFSKPDGTTVLQGLENGVVLAENKIICTLSTNTIAAAGRVHAEVRILNGSNLLTSARFEFYVRRSIVNDETIESTNEFPILNKLIDDVAGITEAVPIIEAKLDEINNTESGLNQSIQDGGTLKTGLDNSIVDANTTKANLDNSILEGNDLKDDLYDIIEGTDFEQVITDLNNKVDKEIVGELENLDTTDKSNIVKAINEVNNKSVDLTPVESRIEDLETDLDAHKAENVTVGGMPHGIIYEEGTWIPQLRIGGSTVGISYSIQAGKYTRNGNNVVAEFEILLTSKGELTGTITITGIPFSTNQNAPRVAFPIGEIRNVNFATQEIVSASIAVNSSTIMLNYNRNGLSTRSMLESDITNTTRLTATFSYNL